jgi:surfactin synthase thioesterase subunit
MAARYYLLPFAGGGHSSYHCLTSRWDGELDTRCLDWSSERYLRQGGITQLARELAEQVANDLSGRPASRFGLFGHSMGALVALELGVALREVGAPSPVVVGVSGRVPPQYGSRPAADPDQPASVAAYLRSCGGELAKAAADPEFVDLVGERLRADIGLGVGYQYRPRSALSCPVVAFGGLADPLATPGELLGWLEHGSDGGSVHLFDGGHWFIWDHMAAVAGLLRLALVGHTSDCRDLARR